jgi:hypothetical protein
MYVPTSAAAEPGTAHELAAHQAQRGVGGEGRHHKQQHRLGEDETKSDVIGSRYRADQWASSKAAHNPAAGHAAAALARVVDHAQEQVLAVVVQVEFESKGLKPKCHFIGSRVETRRFQAKPGAFKLPGTGQLNSTCIARPRSAGAEGSGGGGAAAAAGAAAAVGAAAREEKE